MSNDTEPDQIIIEKDVNGQTGGFLTFTYPDLPRHTDFETYRKTDNDWQKIIKWYNGEKAAMGVENKRGLKERFVLLEWPRNPDGPPMKMTPRGKDTGNGKPTIRPDKHRVSIKEHKGCELWGATLYDFYRVRRIPSVLGLSTICGCY